MRGGLMHLFLPRRCVSRVTNPTRVFFVRIWQMQWLNGSGVEGGGLESGSPHHSRVWQSSRCAQTRSKMVSLWIKSKQRPCANDPHLARVQRISSDTERYPQRRGFHNSHA